jgi:hypothetical protein
MKKLSFLLFAMLLPLMAMGFDAKIDGIYYNFDSEAQTATVTYESYNYNRQSYSGDVTIPAEVNYEGTVYRVTAIGEFAFRDCSGLTSVIIPNGVTTIGEEAFYNCYQMTSITIPPSMTSIERRAFIYCNSNNMTSVHISDIAAWCNISFYDGYSNPLFFANHLFLNGEEIKDLTIPNSVTAISDNAFCRCIGLTSLIIPNSVTSIGNYAFYACSDLTSVTIPSSVTNIGRYAFSGCI